MPGGADSSPLSSFLRRSAVAGSRGPTSSRRGIGHEDDPRAERDLLAAQAVRIAVAVRALVVVQHRSARGIDAEVRPGNRSAGGVPARDASSSSEPACAGSPRGSRACPGRGAGGQPDQLDLSCVEPQPRRDRATDLAHPRRVAARVLVAGVDRLRQACSRPVAGRPVRACAETPQLREVDDIRLVDATDSCRAPWPVERTVGEPNELDPSSTLDGRVATRHSRRPCPLRRPRAGRSGRRSTSPPSV